MLASRNLGDEAGRDGRGDDVMAAVVLTAHQEQFLHVDGVGVAHGRRELGAAGVALLHGDVASNLKRSWGNVSEKALLFMWRRLPATRVPGGDVQPTPAC